MARHLAPSGKSILILERGDWLKREQQNWDVEEVFIKNRYVPKETWYDKTGKPFQPGLHYFVGGATKMFGAALYRLRKEDFGELKHYDGISPAWPIDYEEMEPYYTKAEQMYQCMARVAKTPPSRRPARPILSRRYRTSRASNSCMMIWRVPAIVRSTPHAASCLMSRMRRSAPAFAARTATASRAWSMPNRTPRCWRCVRPCSIRMSPCSPMPRSVKLKTNPTGKAVTEVVVERNGETGNL